jgi:hypothetical protein
LISILVNLAETGIGYQIVKVILKSRTVLRQQKVLNSEMLVLEANEKMSAKDIENIELE